MYMYMFLHVLVHSLLREGILIDMRNFFVSKLSQSSKLCQSNLFKIYSICLENFLYCK